jgi:hypothetical protein
MGEFRPFALLATLLLPVTLVAQHGTASNGYYPIGYNGDTWTGIVSSVEPTTKELSLLYTHQGKTDHFEGVLAKGYQLRANGDKEKQQIMARGIGVGDHLKVYYMSNQTSDDLGSGFPFKVFGNNLLGTRQKEKRRFNLIFLIELLPEDGDSCTGTVISTNDSAREITLAVADGSNTGHFIGVVVNGYRVRMKDGNLRDLVVSQIPTGTKMTVRYFDEVTGQAPTSTEIHRIYRIQFLALPQTP